MDYAQFFPNYSFMRQLSEAFRERTAQFSQRGVCSRSKTLMETLTVCRVILIPAHFKPGIFRLNPSLQPTLTPKARLQTFARSNDYTDVSAPLSAALMRR